jgi:hypothetical protein
MNGKRKPGRPKGPRPPKQQVAVKLTEETRGQLMAAAYWTRQSANAIVEEGIGVVLRLLQQTYNRGKPFPPKPDKPAPGGNLGLPQDATANGEGRAAQGGKGKRQRSRPPKAK